MTAGRNNGAKIPYFSKPNPTKVPSAAPIRMSNTVLPDPEEFRPTAIVYSPSISNIFAFRPFDLTVTTCKCSIFHITTQVRQGSISLLITYRQLIYISRYVCLESTLQLQECSKLNVTFEFGAPSNLGEGGTVLSCLHSWLCFILRGRGTVLDCIHDVALLQGPLKCAIRQL